MLSRNKFRTIKNILIAISLFVIATCDNDQTIQSENNMTPIKSGNIHFKSGYSDVNGMKMYYEIYGEGEPLVLLHGGGSTIQSSFERVIPLFAKTYKVIAIETQNHGRSGFRDTPETFEQDADDVAVLLKNINIDKACFFGFSNGGHTSIEIYLRHPEIVKKLILASTPHKRDCFFPGFFDGFQNATLETMPLQLRQAFLKVTPDSAKLQMMFEKDRDRMKVFKGWSDEQLKSIKVPTLIIAGNVDVPSPECAVEMHRLIANSELAILPGTHGKYIGEIATLNNDKSDTIFIAPMIEAFLDKPEK